MSRWQPDLMRVLVVEDKVKLAALLRRALRGEGLAADVAVRGEDALWMAGASRYDAIVLDVMLPGINGIETCRRLRADGVWTPVLMLTAPGRGGGAGAGARPRGEPVRRPTVLEVGGLRLDPATRQVWRGAVPIELPAKCFSLL